MRGHASVWLVLGAFLTDRTPLTDDRIRKRIQAGAPVYGMSPDRPAGPLRRMPYQMTPEAYAVVEAARLRMGHRQAGVVDRGIEDTGAIYAQAQGLLVTWRKGGGPISPPDFGTVSSDTSGSANPRTEQAIVSFQRWANRGGADIREDGVLDDLTLGQLVVATAGMAKGEIRSVWPWWLVAGGIGLAVLYAEYGGAK